MALYTKAYLRQIAASITQAEKANLYLLGRSKPETFDIFLCHSYLDREEVKGIFLELTRLNYSVYVDWIVDPEFDRNNVSKDTAELIRKRLRSSASLLLAFSINSGISKWMPWELGYVDGHCQNCAIIPVSDQSKVSYDRSEYLLLYPEVLKPGAEIKNKDPLYIMDNVNVYIGIRDWFRGSRPTYQNSRLF